MFGRFENYSYICFVGLRDKKFLTTTLINQPPEWEKIQTTKIMSTLKLNNEQLEQLSNVRNTILEWDSTLQNNPSFDDVCDYIENVFQSAGVEFNYEEQKNLIVYMCKHYLNNK